MMPYTYTKSEELPEGEYECQVFSAEEKTFKSGAKALRITFQIRKDVDQPRGGFLISDNIWEDKATPGMYDQRRINRILGTQADLADGTSFATVQELLAYIKRLNLRVKVKRVYDEYNKGDVAKIVAFLPPKSNPGKALDEAKAVPFEQSFGDLPF